MLMGFLIGFSAQATALFIRRVKREVSSLQRAKSL
jgi:hypothetical protein